jgi:hypothetical protein
MEQTNKRFDAIDQDLKALIGFRWMLLGMSAAVSAIVSVILLIYFGR